MRFRFNVLAAVSVLALTAGAAAAQSPADPPVADTGAPGDQASEVSEIVVTGTRVAGRTRLDSVSPVDVIGEEALERQGTSTELAQALSNLTPAIDFPRPAITDGTDHVRPATLRGLAPDQALVLVNGVRGHIGALVNVNGSIGRGSTAFDLNTIPTVSIGQVEVLRDGASAQYGADAIAGVINLRLREAREGGGVTVNYGMYDTEFDVSRGSREEQDGETISVAGWKGLPLGDDGFLTLSAEYVQRDPTNRSDYVNLAAAPLYPAGTVLGRFGDPEVESYTGFANAELPVNEVWSLYGVAGYQHRESEAAATARAYNNANNVVAIYPNGFLPIIATEIDDVTLIGGFKGEAAGWATDLSLSYGRNQLDYTVLNSLNASYGAASQTEFDAGDLAYEQYLIGADFSRGYELGWAGPLNVAFGAEFRIETFEVGAGEPASYSRGPFAGAPVSQGFPGFRPSNETSEQRHSVGAYLDLEGEVIENLTLGAAVRFEDYSDFGDTTTGKLSARYDFTDAFAIRGSASTGFKAPALQQQFFSYTSTNAVTGPNGTVLIEAGNFRVTDAPAIALGAQPLDAETSVNLSAGVVFQAGGFELTADAYQIKIEDRIVLSETLGVATPSTTPEALATIAAILAPFGVSGARFFLNGVETTTEGIDIVARYRLDTDAIGRFDFTAAANFNQTSVDRVPPLTASQPQLLFDRANRLSFEEGTPERKVVASVDWSLAGFGATLKATNYDSVLIPNNTPSNDYESGEATLIDLDARYEFDMGVNLALGVNNVTDEYPNFTPSNINSPTGSVGFPSYSPFGFNGRFLYARLGYNF